jgi:hypothetical protein
MLFNYDFDPAVIRSSLWSKRSESSLQSPLPLGLLLITAAVEDVVAAVVVAVMP